MTESPVDSNSAPAHVSAGALLRAAREASGMTIDTVAQQLKLAPRQVRAIEDGDYMRLPGRTFVRGFIRNYARLVRLDVESVLSALSAGPATQNLESPALHATAPTMGELPTTEPARHGWTRWAIPLTLIAIIGATAAWEFLHPDSPRVTAKKDAAASAPAKASAPEVIGTPLRNPVASQQASVPVAAAPDKLSATETPEAPVVQAASEPAPDEKAGETPAAAAAPVADAPLVLAFRDFSWTVVKDRTGRVLLSRMNHGGTTQALAGTPPLDLVIGNAADVTLTWKGQRIDLAPYTRQNVARFTLE